MPVNPPDLSNCFSQNISDRTKLFPGCCCELECELTIPSGSSHLNINYIFIPGAFATITEINGVAYTGPTDPPLPIMLTDAPSDSIRVKIQVCGGTIGQLNTVELVVQWNNHGGGSDATQLYFETVDPALYVTPAPPIDFGIVNFGSSASQMLTFTNPTPCDVQYQFSTDCDATLTFDLTSPITVPALGSVNLTATWTPNQTFGNSINCLLQVDQICGDATINPVFVDGPISGVASYPGTCLDCIDVRLETENDYLPPKSNYCIPYETYKLGAIGELKRVVYDFNYTNGLFAGFEIYFNPWLFDFTCNFASKYPSLSIDSPPPVAYYVNYDGTMSGQTMTLIGAGAAANSQLNYNVRFSPISATNFQISFEFFTIQDLDNWLNTTTISNQPKLLRNHVSNPTPFDNSVQSVYNVNKKLCGLIYCVDNNYLVPDPLNPTGPDIPYKCYEIKSIPLTLRFWNKGLYNGPSEFSNPVFKYFRNAAVVTDFSTITPTKVQFDIDSPFGVPPSNILFFLIDASGVNNFTDFITNYDASRAEIITNPTFTQLSNHLYSPSTAPTLVSGSTYRVTCYVNTSVNLTGQYYLGAVVYDTGNFMVNSFISSLITVTNVPGPEDCCGLRFTSLFEDYMHGFAAQRCVKPTMKERVNHYLRGVGIDSFKACFPSIDPDDFTQYLKEIKVNIYRRVDSFPVAGQHTYFYFETFHSIRTPGYPGNWNNLTPGFTVEDFLTDGFQSELLFRVRYENQLTPTNVFVANDPTPFNRTNVGGSLAAIYSSTNSINYNWANQDIIIEYQITVDLSTIIGSPFELTNVYFAGINPWDFELTPSPLLKKIELFELDGSGFPDLTKPITGAFCSWQFDKIAVLVTKENTTPDGSFFAFLDGPNSYTVTNLEEAEGFYSNAPFPLTPLSSPSIPFVELTFGDNYAYFIVDTTTLTPGYYQVCGMYKPIKPGEIITPL